VVTPPPLSRSPPDLADWYHEHGLHAEKEDTIFVLLLLLLGLTIAAFRCYYRSYEPRPQRPLIMPRMAHETESEGLMSQGGSRM